MYKGASTCLLAKGLSWTTSGRFGSVANAVPNTGRSCGSLKRFAKVAGSATSGNCTAHPIS